MKNLRPTPKVSDDNRPKSTHHKLERNHVVQSPIKEDLYAPPRISTCSLKQINVTTKKKKVPHLVLTSLDRSQEGSYATTERKPKSMGINHHYSSPREKRTDPVADLVTVKQKIDLLLGKIPHAGQNTQPTGSKTKVPKPRAKQKSYSISSHPKSCLQSVGSCFMSLFSLVAGYIPEIPDNFLDPTFTLPLEHLAEILSRSLPAISFFTNNQLQSLIHQREYNQINIQMAKKHQKNYEYLTRDIEFTIGEEMMAELRAILQFNDDYAAFYITRFTHKIKPLAPLRMTPFLNSLAKIDEWFQSTPVRNKKPPFVKTSSPVNKKYTGFSLAKTYNWSLESAERTEDDVQEKLRFHCSRL